MDAALDVKLLVTIVATIAALAIAAYVLCARGSKQRGGGSRAAPSARVRARTVLLAGPPGSGKTALVHRLAFGARVESVAGARELALHTPLHASHGAAAAAQAPLTLVDYPGIGQLRAALLRAAHGSGAIVVVLDATGNATHDALAAECVGGRGNGAWRR